MTTWPVSAKGVVVESGRVLLALNNRSEWELPGGRLDPEEDLETCVKREFLEETGLRVAVGQILHAWVYEVVPTRRVVVLAFHCLLLSNEAALRTSPEHGQVRFVEVARLDDINMADGYRRAIRLALEEAHR